MNRLVSEGHICVEDRLLVLGIQSSSPSLASGLPVVLFSTLAVIIASLLCYSVLKQLIEENCSSQKVEPVKITAVLPVCTSYVLQKIAFILFPRSKFCCLHRVQRGNFCACTSSSSENGVTFLSPAYSMGKISPKPLKIHGESIVIWVKSSGSKSDFIKHKGYTRGLGKE